MLFSWVCPMVSTKFPIVGSVGVCRFSARVRKVAMAPRVTLLLGQNLGPVVSQPLVMPLAAMARTEGSWGCPMVSVNLPVVVLVGGSRFMIRFSATAIRIRVSGFCGQNRVPAVLQGSMMFMLAMVLMWFSCTDPLSSVKGSCVGVVFVVVFVVAAAVAGLVGVLMRVVGVGEGSVVVGLVVGVVGVVVVVVGVFVVS